MLLWHLTKHSSLMSDILAVFMMKTYQQHIRIWYYIWNMVKDYFIVLFVFMFISSMFDFI